MKILDATCGTKSMWYQKNHPLVTYLDKRSGDFIYQTKSGSNKTTIKINPDVVADWTETIPYSDNEFDMILFDPPHFIRNKTGGKCAAYYGYLPIDNWKQILIKGINELFRVLKPKGVFIFKWAESCKPITEVIKLFPYPPIFGNRTWKANPTKSNEVYWLVFLKYDVNMKLTDLETQGDLVKEKYRLNKEK